MERVLVPAGSVVFGLDYAEPDRPEASCQVLVTDEVRLSDGERRYEDIDGSGISATIRVRSDGPSQQWSIAVECSCDLIIRQLHFPYVVVPYRSAHGPVRLVAPVGCGRLLTEPKPHELRPWPWDAPIGNQDAVLTLLRRALALRRDARKFLVYGRLHRHSGVTDVEQVRWAAGDQLHRRPAVYAARWTSAEGDVGTVLANWTDAQAAATVQIGGCGTFRLYNDDLREELTDVDDQSRLVLPPLTVGLLTLTRSKEEI